MPINGNRKPNTGSYTALAHEEHLVGGTAEHGQAGTIAVSSIAGSSIEGTESARSPGSHAIRVTAGAVQQPRRTCQYTNNIGHHVQVDTCHNYRKFISKSVSRSKL